MRLGMYRRSCFYIPAYKRRKYKLCFVLYLIVFLLFCGCILFVSRVRPVLLTRAAHYADETATSIINTAVDEVFSADGADYRDLVYIDKNSDGDIISIQANTVEMNRIKAAVTQSIQEHMEEQGGGYVKIPFGSVLGSELLAGSGPNIPAKMQLSGVVHVDFADVFESSGINQTKHKIYLNVALTMSVVSTTIHKSETVHNQIPIAETIIVGHTPNYYSSNGSSILASGESTN